MKRVSLCVSVCLALLAAAIFAGCGGTSPTIAISLAPGTALALDEAQSINISASVANSSQGVNWSLAGPGTLSAQTATSVTYTAPGSGSGAATITATSVQQPSVSTSVAVTVDVSPTISTANTQTELTANPATGGVAYSYNFAGCSTCETGGAGTLTWSAAGLPADGLSLSSAGLLSGTPTTTGTLTFTLTVRDSSAAGAMTSTSGSLTLTINKPAAPTINTTQAQVSAATVGTPYAFTFNASGTGALTWSAAGLPADGLALDASTGVVSGTPTSPQSVAMTLTVSDSFGQSSSATGFTITVNPAPLAITTTSLPGGTIGTAYSQSIAVTGGTTPYTWSVSSGSLPAGLTLDTSTGAISGTPTSAAVSSSFTISVTDSSSPQMSATQNLSIPIGLVITTTSLPDGAVNTAYSTTTVVAEGGTLPYAWSISAGTLPAGLVLSPSTGAISGTVAGNATNETFTVKVQDSSATKQTQTQSLTIAIPLAVETSSLSNGAIGTTYNQTVAVGGGTTPYTFTITTGSLPDGLSLNGSTGVISGTPKPAAQSESFTISIGDSSSPQQTVTQNLSIFIPLTIETTSLPSGSPNVAYSANVNVGGGRQAYAWAVTSGALPPPLTLNTAQGSITGTPATTDSGVYSFAVTVTDSTLPTPLTATQSLSITISPVSVSSTQPSNATIGTSYNDTPVTASGGATPYTYAVASGTLPSGLSLNTSTGAITGTPDSSAIDEAFSISVTDSSVPANTATSSTLNMIVDLATTTTSPLPAGTVSTAYSQQIAVEGGQPPYSYSVDASGNALPAGLSLSSSGAVSGTPTTAGTTSNVLVDVSDSAATTQTIQPAYAITINPADPCASAASGSESLLNGQYAFVLKGFDNGQGSGESGMAEPALVGGVLTLDGSGNITAGTLDMNLNATAGVQSNSITSGSYKVGSDGRACMTITTPAGTQHYRLSLGNISGGVASTGHMIDFDANGPFTAGTMLKQDTTAFSTSKVTGNYAFGVSAAQNTVTSQNSISGGKFGVAGVFNLSTGSVTGGVLDTNGNGQLDQNASCTDYSTCTAISISSGGSYTIDATSGRGTLTFTPSGASQVSAVIYVVSSNEFLILNSEDQTNNSVFAGTALLQASTPSVASLNGTSVFYLSQPNVGGTGTSTSIGTVATTGTGSITVFDWQNSDGTVSCGPNAGTDVATCSATATYSVSTSGRTTLTGAGNHSPVFYIVSANEAFMLGGGGSVETGMLDPQSAKTASGTFAFGTIDPGASTVSDSVGVITLNSGNSTGTSDDNSSGSQNAGQAISGTYSIDSTGLILIPASCTPGGGASPCQNIGYVISSTKAAITSLESQSGATTQPQTNPSIQNMDQ